MAALLPDSNISDVLLTCKLCKGTLNQPKLLPCQHSFCKKCLIKNMNQPDFTVTCPCCERIVKIVKGDIEQFPDNYLIPIILKQAQPGNILNQIEEKERIELKDSIKQLDSIQEKESEISDHLDKTSQSLKKERESTEIKIQQASDELHALIDKLKEGKLQEMKYHYEEELQRIETLKHKLQVCRNHTELMKSFSDTFLRLSSDDDYRGHCKDVENRVKDFLDKKEDLCLTARHMHIETDSRSKDAIDRVVKGILGNLFVWEKYSKKSGKIQASGEKEGPQVLFETDLDFENGYLSGLTVTEGNDIIAVGGSKIGVFGNDGQHKKWIQCEEVQNACDVTVKGEDIYISDNTKRETKVLMIDMNGTLQKEIFMPDEEQIGRFGWYNLSPAMDKNGCLYIASQKTNTVYKCSMESSIPEPFLTESSHPGMQSPRAICITPNQELVVLNIGSNNIQAYNFEGELLWQYDAKAGTVTPCDMIGICCDQEGNVFVADCEDNKILVLHGGALIGTIEPYGLNSPLALAVNSAQELVILTSNFKILKVGFCI